MPSVAANEAGDEEERVHYFLGWSDNGQNLATVPRIGLAARPATKAVATIMGRVAAVPCWGAVLTRRTERIRLHGRK
jgi:hypothetical protein